MSRYPSPQFEHYLAMWNEPEPTGRRAHLERAVSEDFVFCDPANHHVGRDALEDNVAALQAAEPDFRYDVASGFDHHHDLYRYGWRITRGEETVLEGLDIARVAEDGTIVRIDGFFGPLPPLD